MNVLPFKHQMNDYALLKSVKYGFAMENAVDEIKKLAYGITDSNENQGCLKIIKKALRKIKSRPLTTCFKIEITMILDIK